jgi:hypothetical protein
MIPRTQGVAAPPHNQHLQLTAARAGSCQALRPVIY